MNEYRIKEYNGKFIVQIKVESYSFECSKHITSWYDVTWEGSQFIPNKSISNTTRTNHWTRQDDFKSLKKARKAIKRFKLNQTNTNTKTRFYTSEGVEIK